MIVCLGTTPALARTMEFDGLTIDGVNRATSVIEYAAGKAVNAARAASLLGEEVIHCVSPVGGATGDRFAAASRQDRVNHAFVPVAPATRLCVTVVDRQKRTSTELIQETAALSSEDGQRLFEAFDRQVDANSVCVLSGSLAPGLPAESFERCASVARDRGARVILDASGEPLRRAVAGRVDVVKVNVAELATVSAVSDDGDEAVIAAARRLCEQTGGWVIVTRGKRPTLAAHADGSTLEVSVADVEVVSAIGSGDSFAGALAVALSRGEAMPSALKLASAAASANAMTALAAHFDRADVERLFAHAVAVREVA